MVPPTQSLPPRILVVGGEEEDREAYVAELCAAGLLAEARGGLVEDGEGADLILIAGGVPGSRRDGLGAVVDAVAATRKAIGPGAVVVCVPREAGTDAIQASFDSGADDVVLVPAGPAMLLNRVRSAQELGAARLDADRFSRYGDALVAIGAQAELSLDAADTLHELLGRLVDVTGWARIALLLLGDDITQATLVAASDEPSPIKVPLELRKYPEVCAAIEIREPVLILDTRSSSLMGEWSELAAEKGGAALLAVPILVERRVVGVLLLRAAERSPRMPPRSIDFLRLAALSFGLMLKAGRAFEALREQTNRMPLHRYNEERRGRAIEQYRDFFESSPDGIIVLDADARVLYVNRAAQEMTGYAQEGLSGQLFTDLVAPMQQAPVKSVVGQVAAGVTLESFDLNLSTTSGETLTVSVSASAALADHRAAVLSFRDVTERRMLEGELRKTKEFLERLIDSTVDGIISADLRGHILIFNQGAARLYGYDPDEVIGKVSVHKLYPDGVARAIMAELRASDHAGPGRLQPSRRDIVTKDGDLVPVSLTASIIYENGREVATVGILSDLRDRLRIEQRLLQAQEKLLLTEKQALIAELAGTAAHELNQPLTSVMGYSELLKKKLSPEDPNFRAVDIILREAERMAEIVRKIGRITRYETKTYVGSTTILDLDKSSDGGESDVKESG